MWYQAGSLSVDRAYYTYIYQLPRDSPSEMLSIRNSVIFLLILSVLHLTNGRKSHEHRTSFRSEDNDFDVLIFTQHWPETVCFQWKEDVPSHRCLLPGRNEWTIHGIWPDKFHKIGPLYCNKTQRFNESALIPIVHQLDEKWINIEDGTPHFSFWKHEWDKHGTCASVIEDLNTELKYFQKGLDLLDEYDMTRLLAKANILPGRNYAIQKILDGVEKILGKTVLIECVQNSKTHESYLFEIRICFNKSLELTDCNDIPDFPTNCDRKKPVNYPATTPAGYEVVLI